MQGFGRLNGYDLYIGVEFFEPPSGSHKSAACTDSRKKVGDPAVCLLPDLRSRCLIMRQWICRVIILVGHKVFIRVLGLSLLATFIAPSEPSRESERIIFAPKASSVLFLSIFMFAGVTSSTL